MSGAPGRLLAAASCAIAACATGGGAGRSGQGAAADPVGAPACFYTRQVVDFRVLDGRNLIVYAPSRSSAYHVQISPPASALRQANGIAFASRGSRVCGYAGDSLYLRDAPERPYAVIGVYRLDELGTERLLGRFGLGPAAEPLEAEQPDGAEIEPLDEPDPGGDQATRPAN